MKYYKYLIFFIVVLGVVVWNFSYTKSTSSVGQESSTYRQGYNDYRYEQVDKFNKAVNDLDTVIKFTTGTFQDSIYKSAIKCTRLRPDSIVTTAVKATRLRSDSVIVRRVAFQGFGGAGTGTLDSIFLADSSGTAKDTLILKVMGKVLKIFCDVGE